MEGKRSLDNYYLLTSTSLFMNEMQQHKHKGTWFQQSRHASISNTSITGQSIRRHQDLKVKIDQISSPGESRERIAKPGKNSIFLKNGKTVISVENLEVF